VGNKCCYPTGNVTPDGAIRDQIAEKMETKLNIHRKKILLWVVAVAVSLSLLILA
jgi:hypothetical protein